MVCQRSAVSNPAELTMISGFSPLMNAVVFSFSSDVSVRPRKTALSLCEGSVYEARDEVKEATDEVVDEAKDLVEEEEEVMERPEEEEVKERPEEEVDEVEGLERSVASERAA